MEEIPVNEKDIRRTFVNRKITDPALDFDGERFFDIEKKSIYERVKGKWTLKYCNKSCLPTMEVYVLNEGLTEKL